MLSLLDVYAQLYFIMCGYLIKDNFQDLLETKTEITLYINI